MSSKKLHGQNIIHLDPDATTTLTGTLNDVNTVAVRGERLPGITVMGENPGAINILRSRRWVEIQTKHRAILDAGDVTEYWNKVTNEFWETVNEPWLEEAIARGDGIRLVSDPANDHATHVTQGREFVLAGGRRIRSIFGREVDMLIRRGYTC